jgi:hypothetical protein
MLEFLLVLVAAYLIGSLSFAVIMSRLFGMPDPRSYGSGNPGATNVLRTGRKAVAALTLLGDALKGVVAILDSMTPDERRRPEIVNGSRKKRIARGSGTSVPEINRLLKQFAQMRRMMKAVQAQQAAGRKGLRLPFLGR